MDTEIAVKPEPLWFVEDKEVNHVDAKNEAVLSASICDKGNRMLNTDIDTEEKCLLEDSSECNYSDEKKDSEVTVKQESMWLVEDEDVSQAHVTDEGIVSAADCDEINKELKTEIDIEENCILGDSSAIIRSCKVAEDTTVLENEGIIISSTDELQVGEGYTLKYEELVTVNVEKSWEGKNSTKKYSQRFHNSFSKCTLTSKTQLKCDICGKCFKTYHNIVQRINSHTLGKTFKCEVCYKFFTHSGNLKVHMNLHTGEKAFKCKECSKRFTQSGHLKDHMRLHTGEKPFTCDMCSKCFTQSGNLKNHMRLHTGEKAFKCKECSKRFSKSGHLKDHMRLHTGEKPFKCKECCECFNQSSILRQHAMTHTEEKPYKCKKCSKGFTLVRV